MPIFRVEHTFGGMEGPEDMATPDGWHIAYDANGKPWGFVDMSGQLAAVRALEEATFLTRQEWTAYLVKECHLSPNTAFAYDAALQRPERHYDKPAEMLSIPEMRAWIRDTAWDVMTGEGLQPRTQNLTVCAIKALHRWGMLDDKPWANPKMLALRGPKITESPKEYLTPAQARVFLDACNRPTAYRVVWLGLYAGLRVSESAELTSEDWRDDRLKFIGKGRKWREVPIHRDLAPKKDIILSRPTTRNTLKATMRSLSVVLGIKAGSHTLRHTFARMLREERVTREVVGSLLGHAPKTTTEIYDPVADWEKFEAMDKLDYPPVVDTIGRIRR